MAESLITAPVRSAAEWGTRIEALRRSGEFVAAYDAAEQALLEHPDELRLRYQAVRCLASAGSIGQARARLATLGLIGHADEDVAALEARLVKDEALAATGAARTALAERSAVLYAAIQARTGGHFPAINAATMRLLAGAPDEARRLAEAARTAAVAGADSPYYLAATRAEAALLLDDPDAAALVRAAADLADGDIAAMARTRAQLLLVCGLKRIDPGLLAPLAPPPVIFYAGHRIAQPGRAGRFAPASEAAVAAAIAAHLDAHKVGYGYGALASGADILFAEALLARGAELHVVLPFRQDDFVAVSVADSGADWVARFDACLARAHSVVYATDDQYLGHPEIFTYAARLAMGLAVIKARGLDAEIHQVAVWDGAAGSEGGTHENVANWQAYGYRTTVIPCGPPAAGPLATPVVLERDSPPRKLRAMLFGDVRGFSKLGDAELPSFLDHVMAVIGGAIDRHRAEVLYRNTWGDGFYIVMADAVEAARCALDIQNALATVDLAAAGLPAHLALRIGGHLGPVFEREDPVMHSLGFFGAHVSRTARIEPVTPPGHVYVSEPFAARLALLDSDFALEYVGQMPAAKNYGTLRMYLVKDTRAASEEKS